MKKFEQRVFHLVPGDKLTLDAEEDAVVFFLPVRDFFPQYEKLRSIFFSGVKQDD